MNDTISRLIETNMASTKQNNIEIHGNPREKPSLLKIITRTILLIVGAYLAPGISLQKFLFSYFTELPSIARLEKEMFIDD